MRWVGDRWMGQGDQSFWNRRLLYISGRSEVLERLIDCVQFQGESGTGTLCFDFSSVLEVCFFSVKGGY